jgi:hypothetical protein
LLPFYAEILARRARKKKNGAGRRLKEAFAPTRARGRASQNERFFRPGRPEDADAGD